MARKKQARDRKPGDVHPFYLSDNKVVNEFLNNQSNANEGLRIAVEMFVGQFGNIDVSKYVPARREPGAIEHMLPILELASKMEGNNATVLKTPSNPIDKIEASSYADTPNEATASNVDTPKEEVNEEENSETGRIDPGGDTGDSGVKVDEEEPQQAAEIKNEPNEISKSNNEVDDKAKVEENNEKNLKKPDENPTSGNQSDDNNDDDMPSWLTN